MSHSIDYYQSMSTDELIREMNHAYWNVDRQRARQVYEARMREQRRREQVSSSNLQRLNQNITSLTNQVNTLSGVNANLRRIIENQNQNLVRMQQGVSRQITELQRDYSQRVDRMQEEHRTAMRTLENQIETAVFRSEQELEARMNTAIQESERRTDQLVSDAANALNSRINRVHEAVSQQLAEQQAQINTLEAGYAALRQEDQQLYQQAVEYRDAALAVINATIDYNNANQHNWRQEDLSALLSLRDNIQADLQSHGMLSIGATRMQARQLFEGAMAYRANVYADQREWQLRQAAAQQSVSEAMIDLDASRHIEVDDMDIDVDYWTCGDLHRIEEQLQQLQSLADQPGTSNSDLEHIGQLAETYRQEIQRAVQFAMQARQFSFDRKELLEEAVSHITARFGTIRPEWEEYFAGDERFGYRVYLTAPSGERLVLTAEPVSNAQGEGDIRNQFRYDILSVGNSIHNSQEARAFMQDLERALQDLEGCRFTTASCTNTAAPAQDNGQSNHQVWRNPTPAQVQTAAQRATPTPAAPQAEMPRKPAPFKPRSSV